MRSMLNFLIMMLQGKVFLFCLVSLFILRPWLKYGVLTPTKKCLNLLDRLYLFLYEAILVILIINGLLIPLPVIALISIFLPNRREFLHFWGRLFTNLFLWVIGVKVSIQGKENIPQGAAILVQNIRGYLDGAASLAAIPATFRMIFKRTLIDYPLLRWVAKVPGDLTLEPEELSLMHNDVLKILKVLSQGEKILTFAEEKLGGFEIHGSTALFALKSNLPVVPIRIFRKTTAPRVGAFLAHPFPYAIEIVVGKPLRMSELVDDRVAREEVKKQISQTFVTAGPQTP